MRKIILFTFDYELFLGVRSGKVRDCIIEPTDTLLGLLRKYQFKSVFFVDTVYLLRLHEMAKIHEAARKDEEAIHAQLQRIVQENHYIYPHIHPHWLDAVYDPVENEWSLQELRFYQFSALCNTQQARLFNDSVQLIKCIAKKVDASYTVDSYRAGGWSIQPFKVFKPYFLQHGIRHEWSVLPGKYNYSDAHAFDFRCVPENTTTYRFNDDVNLRDENGTFVEWTISILALNRFEKWFNFKVNGLMQRLLGKPERKGKTVSSSIKEEGDVYRKKNGSRMTASFEGLNPFLLLKYLLKLRKSSYYHFITHPKLLRRTELYLVGILFRILSKQHNSIETDFRKVSP